MGLEDELQRRRQELGEQQADEARRKAKSVWKGPHPDAQRRAENAELVAAVRATGVKPNVRVIPPGPNERDVPGGRFRGARKEPVLKLDKVGWILLNPGRGKIPYTTDGEDGIVLTTDGWVIRVPAGKLVFGRPKFASGAKDKLPLLEGTFDPRGEAGGYITDSVMRADIIDGILALQDGRSVP